MMRGLFARHRKPVALNGNDGARQIEAQVNH